MGVTAVSFSGRAPSHHPRNPMAAKHVQQTLTQLKEYIAGKRKVFTVPLDLGGTEFQDTVWSALYEVPYGSVITYRELAKLSGSPRAVRAVGTAMRMNPVCILIPCHRVVPSSGGIGSYNGGVAKKKFLLALEKVRL